MIHGHGGGSQDGNTRPRAWRACGAAGPNTLHLLPCAGPNTPLPTLCRVALRRVALRRVALGWWALGWVALGWVALGRVACWLACSYSRVVAWGGGWASRRSSVDHLVALLLLRDSTHGDDHDTGGLQGQARGGGRNNTGHHTN